MSNINLIRIGKEKTMISNIVFFLEKDGIDLYDFVRYFKSIYNVNISIDSHNRLIVFHKFNINSFDVFYKSYLNSV
jgi:hypothetical protein